MKKLTSVMLSVLMIIGMIFVVPFKAEAETKSKSYNFSDMTYNLSYGVDYYISGGKLNATFKGKYQEIRFYLPETLDMSMCKNVTFNAKSTNGNISFKLYDVDGKETSVKYNFKADGDCTFVPDSTAKVNCIAIMSMESYNFDAVVNSVSFSMGVLIENNPISPDRNLLTTYGQAFDTVGVGVVASKVLNKTILDYTKQEHNSITPGNEMKPDAILGGSSKVISVDEAKELGYYIPEDYAETTVPQLNFSTVDSLLKTCYENGMTMRGHTLVWHEQTPDWYFREGYSSNGNYVTKEEMDKRLEFYIKSVMSHVYSGEYGSVLYAWDVVNEYLHASNSGWQNIYGSNLGTKPEFVKKAFEYAYETLEKYGLENKVKLFYNDYNTYEKVNEAISLINYINSDKKICTGIGMQSHLDTNYPSVSNYKKALQAFVYAGFEVQITELDVTCSSLSVQAKYYYDLMSAILQVKKSGGNITALIFWGLTDEDSWRQPKKPLLYSDYSTQKEAYASVLKAFDDSGYVPDKLEVFGDINKDGAVDENDFTLLKEYVDLGRGDAEGTEKDFDINKDGTINFLDLIALRNLL